MLYLINNKKNIIKLLKTTITSNITVIIKSKIIKVIKTHNKITTTAVKKITNINTIINKQLKKYLRITQVDKQISLTIIITNLEILTTATCIQFINIYNQLSPKHCCFCIYTEAALKLINLIKHKTHFITLKIKPNKNSIVYKNHKEYYKPPIITIPLKTIYKLMNNIVKKKSTNCTEKKLMTTLIKKLNDNQIFIQ
ncbi:hypothetical protein ACWNX2_00360 [Candidatus Vidania fulgoroideorum]